MYFYFSSNYPAVLKLNGIYYGVIHNQIKSCKVDGADSPFIEVCPLGGKEKPTALILDKDFLACPPEQISLTNLGGGYMLNFFSNYLTDEFKVFCQQKFQNAVATAFSENGYKLSIETREDFYAENLALELSSAKIIQSEKYKNLIIVYLYGSKNVVNIYDITSKINKIFTREVESAEFGDSLVTVESLSDMAKHKITTEWRYENNGFIAKNKKIQAQESLELDKLNDKVIPFAFLEELFAGGDYLTYLCEDIKKNGDKLNGFFGEFIGVMPPPIFRNIDDVGLIYQKKSNTYFVEYFNFEIKEKKIVNISKC